MRRGQELEEADVWEGEPAGHAAPSSLAGHAADAADGAPRLQPQHFRRRWPAAASVPALLPMWCCLAVL